MEHNRPYKRKERVSELIQRELGQIILREVELTAITTITRVEVTAKLDFARVYISVLPDDKLNEALKLLGRRSRYLQSLLLRKLNIKPMPTIGFYEDKGAASAAKVEKALLEEKE
ncbi:MAG: ribosome-binding factor A [Candidatus Harrisonbacteria bacterium CG10_big_fil_rev_8_21_14_0_10_49_15]|uniref:Ribosome-binding factor A n=1 Tax=Candidatus Harrisonbacteria bacterium CG10_big_fil_rev_8_21_14_0_10_49_15 TaxID=1974587 RepID=A0A2H0UJN5_9BACT|nr:MAG: ribosome-binding factor A [Candidatus Harrisonbacteria bacterium CG10_big_fil_rev_8_21_14_0_10_49_15]